MNDKQDRPYACGAPGCSQRFQLEEHLLIHRHKHEMTLKFPPIKTDTTFSAQTPTPTRFLQNCEEVGLFKEIEEEFLQAQEEEKNKQTLSHNGPSCMNQQHLKPQLQLQHPPQPQLPHPQAPLHHPQSHGPMMAPSCSLAAQQALSCSSATSQSGSVITQAPSTLTHSGPAAGALSCLLHMRNRHRQPLPASLPGTLPDPAMQGASAQHMTQIQKQMSCAMGIAAPGQSPSCCSPQRPKLTMGHHYQHQHPGMLAINNSVTSMGHMMEMMPQRHHAPSLQQQHPHPHHPHHPNHHHHNHPSQPPQISAPPHIYQQRCHAPPPQHLGSTQSLQLHQSGNTALSHAHQSPPSRLQQNSPPAPPLSAPPQLSPVAQQMQPSHSQHAAQPSCSGSSSGGSSGGGAGGSSSRRRRTAEQDPDERRQKFLERNRAAATRCRQKRKLWVSSLEKKAEELTHTNLQLQNEVTSLRSEVGQLKQILLTHKDCPVTARQREAQGYPTAGVSPGGSPTPADPETHLHAVQHNSVSTSSTAGSDIGHGPLTGL
ncbi:PREDICTED: cyclic AMP-responsive element-binding protein 5-like isoform X1 [Cyprinodon variegatus]|uniref:cyclic AMP-responsive element-binding protein 5-like isoform X1 n=1 Tax=Cyprinodon variegatus TaxID=28743 RepID=UPI0007426CC7|nr:PREDICTED: cyclic AMP-responsive element-binding protein 5-like isoform X1 [Cyprinodon variegatus]XP_015229657.1 PREDICTED: cyclic AMP-responsive element-binding protein 5-like isoform X1 [Cyprinodon variegatus]